MMFVPFMLNYLLCWYAWATTDKRKTITWVAALLNFYPQFVACKIIWLIWRDPKTGLQKKKKLERELIQSETFCEAVPTFFVLTYLFLFAVATISNDSMSIMLIFDYNDTRSIQLFMIAYVSSALTATLGIAKNLKVGPCRILKEETGLYSPSFIIIFLSCFFTMVGKVAIFALPIVLGGVGIESSIAAPLIILPGLLVGLFALWHPGLLKTSFAHPSIILMPAFTHFTFVYRKLGSGEKVVSFSPKYTLVNAATSCVGFLLHFATTFFLIGPRDDTHTSWLSAGDILPLQSGPPAIGLLLTLGVTFLRKCFHKTCCCCCADSSERGAILTSSLHDAYILGLDDELVPMKNEQAAFQTQQMQESRA